MLRQRFFHVLILIAVVIGGGFIVWQQPALLQPRVAQGQQSGTPASLPSGCSQAPLTTFPSFNVQFDEPTNRLGQITWPVSVGVPFANGALTNPQLTTTTEQGVALPTQMKILGQWREGAKTPKWALLDFQANFGQSTTPCVRVQANRAPATPLQTVSVTETPQQISVNTGKVAFTVSRTNFSLFETFTSNGAPVLANGGSSLYWIDQADRRFEAKAYGRPNVTVETNGPMKVVIKAEGFYQAAGVSEMMKYQVRITAFAGLPYVRVYHTLIWTEVQAYNIKVENSSTETWSFTCNPVQRKDNPNCSAASLPTWANGQEVRVTTSGELPGANPPQRLISNTVPYYVRMLSPTTFRLYTTAADAQADRAPLAIVNGGTGNHTIVATTPAMKDFGLQFTTATANTQARIGLEGGTTLNQSLNTPVEVVQDTYSSGRIIQSGSATRNITRSSGWVEARNGQQGLAVSVRDLAMQTPKAFTVTSNSISTHLWAPQAGPMSMVGEDRVPQSILQDDGRGGKEIYDGARADWDVFNPALSPVGVAKTHELWVWPTAPADNPAIANDMVQRPVVAMANPRYQASTNAISGLRAKEDTPEPYRFIEEGLDNMFRHIVARNQSTGDYEMWNFGEVHLFQETGWRSNDNGGYNWPQTPWRLFYRSGERQYLEEGVRNARHVMDVDTVHHEPPGTVWPIPAYEKGLGRTHGYSALHWGLAPMYDTFWAHPEYLLYNYYLTGYERAADVLKLMADVPLFQPPSTTQPICTPIANDPNFLSLVERAQYGVIHPRFVYYEFTGDQRQLDCARIWGKVATDAYAANNGNFPNNRMFGFFYKGLEKLYYQTRDAVVKNSLIGRVGAFVNIPAQETIPLWDIESTLPFTFAYRETNNARYLSYPVWRTIEQLKGTQTISESATTQFYGGPGYAGTPRLYYPIIIENALDTLGAWKDQGFAALGSDTLPGWPGNGAYLASTPDSVGAYQSRLTLFTQKPAGVAGEVRLKFGTTGNSPEHRAVDATVNPATDVWTTTQPHQFSNGLAVGVSVFGTSGFHTQGTYGRPAASTPPLAYAGWRYVSVLSPTTFAVHTSHADAVAGQNRMNFTDAGDGRHSFSTLGTMAATITYPSGTTKDVIMGTLATEPAMRTLSFTPSDEAGTYKIDVRANQEVFWVSPSTTFSKLVTEIPNQTLTALFFEPGRVYFKPEPGKTQLNVNLVNAHINPAAPVWIRNEQDAKVGMLPYPGSGQTTINLPVGADQSLLSLQRGLFNHFYYTTAVLPGVKIQGALPYVAVTPSQWFDPTIVVAPPPTIDAPTAVSVRQGETVRFTVTAHGTGTVNLTATFNNLLGALFELRIPSAAGLLAPAGILPPPEEVVAPPQAQPKKEAPKKKEEQKKTSEPELEVIPIASTTPTPDATPTTTPEVPTPTPAEESPTPTPN